MSQLAININSEEGRSQIVLIKITICLTQLGVVTLGLKSMNENGSDQIKELIGLKIPARPGLKLTFRFGKFRQCLSLVRAHFTHLQ